MHLYSNTPQTITFLNSFFFFAKKCCPLIKQIIFQKHCFNDKVRYPISRSHEILHVRGNKPCKQSTHNCSTQLFYSTTERIALGYILIFITIGFVRKT